MTGQCVFVACYINAPFLREMGQETWLILPVVICLFQGLSHASLRVTETNRRSANGSLYQTLSTGKIAVKTASMDNFAKREANTCTARDVLHQTTGGKTLVGRASREWLKQRPTPAMAASQSDESNHSFCFGTRVPTNFCPISF